MVETSLTTPPRVGRAGGDTSQATISAQRKPASSRATAVTTMLRELLVAARRRNLAVRWIWAFQARAMVSSVARA
jgi:hypothetical protein